MHSLNISGGVAIWFLMNIPPCKYFLEKNLCQEGSKILSWKCTVDISGAVGSLKHLLTLKDFIGRDSIDTAVSLSCDILEDR